MNKTQKELQPAGGAKSENVMYELPNEEITPRQRRNAFDLTKRKKAGKFGN